MLRIIVKMRFEATFTASDWVFSGFKYSLRVPLLGATSSVDSRFHFDELKGVGERTYRLLHTGDDGHETDVRISMPTDVSHTVAKPDLYNPVTLCVEHVLYRRWWAIVLQLCNAGRDGDIDVWLEAWRDLRRTCVDRHAGLGDALLENTPLQSDTVAVVRDMVIFGEPGWSQGACKYALYHVHDALRRGVRGADAVLAHLLANSDEGLDRVRFRARHLHAPQHPGTVCHPSQRYRTGFLRVPADLLSNASLIPGRKTRV